MPKLPTVTMTLDYPAGCPADLVAWQTNASERHKAAVLLSCANGSERFGVNVGGLAKVSVDLTGSDWLKLRTPPFRVTIEGQLARAPDETDASIKTKCPELWAIQTKTEASA